jgi:hypothetical protein
MLRQQRTVLREALVQFTEEHALKFGCPPEAIVQEIRYWQQSNAEWRTNPQLADKRRSFDHYHGICQAPECGLEITSIDAATFHHWQRGIPKPHSPENMVPLHRDGDCHERLHNAKRSLTAGSLRRKPKPVNQDKAPQ